MGTRLNSRIELRPLQFYQQTFDSFVSWWFFPSEPRSRESLLTISSWVYYSK